MNLRGDGSSSITSSTSTHAMIDLMRRPGNQVFLEGMAGVNAL